MLLIFLVGILGLLFQSIGLIGLFAEKMWAKHFFSIGVGASAITSISGQGGMAENRFLALLALCYWIVAGAIIALSYEKQNLGSAENI